MTQEQVLREFEALPREEQEMVARAIYLHLHPHEEFFNSIPNHPQANASTQRMAALERLQGALKWPGKAPSDEEVDALRSEYLTRKYR